MNDNQTFAEKYPRINFLIGLLLGILIVIIALIVIKWVFLFIGDGIIQFKNFLTKFVNTTDTVIVVAMITGTVSIVSVLISSFGGKIFEYKYNVKKYLYDKKEEPYKQFIEMVYSILEDSKKDDLDKMSVEEMNKMLSDLSKGLTLWGSNRVVRKWLEFRKSSMKGNLDNKEELLFQLEDLIYEIRRDVGLGRRLKKGDMLSFFINDIEKYIK